MRWRGITAGTALTVLVLAVVSNAQVDTAWVRHYAGPVGVPELSVAIELDALGNVFVGGTTYNGITDHDYIILKYDSEGNLLWDRQYNGLGDSTDAVMDLTLDGQGYVYVTGYSWGDTPGYDIVTIAYDADGNLLWEARYDGGSSTVVPTAIKLDVNGNVYVPCSYRGGSWAWGGYFLLKYDSEGNFLWDGSPYWASTAYRPPALAIDNAGNAYLAGDAGWQHGTPALIAKFDPNGVSLFEELYSLGWHNVFFNAIGALPDGGVVIAGFGLFDNLATCKISSTGQVVWYQEYENPGYNDLGIDLSLDNDENVLVLGYVYGGDREAGGSSYDYVTWKLDINGTSQWARRYNGPGDELDWPLDICIDNDGSAYTFGYSQELLGSYDWVVLKYATDGLPLWEYRFDGSGDDPMAIWYNLPGAVTIDPTGDVYAAGYTYSEANGFMLTTIKIDASCHCGYQADSEPDGFITAIDLAVEIDALFAGGENPQDVGCPVPRFDLDCDGFLTALDLSVMIDYLFAGGAGPCDPCE